MPPEKNDWDPKSSWVPYVPGDAARWDLPRVVHLHRRAGFAGTWNELQRDLKDGPEKSIDRLLKGKDRDGVPENFQTTADGLATRAENTGGADGLLGKVGDARALKAWWAYRLYHSPNPLAEQATLMWHNHFATSNDKLNDAVAMRRQNEIFRKYGLGPFAELLRCVIHDPAILLWLDAPVNRKGRPNENLGRELMELFTLGIGNYTETDVKEAARCLTGWGVSQGRFRHSDVDHDDGEKTVLGKRGKWAGEDLVTMLLEHPATSRRLAKRICEWLMGEKGVSAAALDALAKGLTQHELNVGWAVETVLRSKAFFDESNLRNRVVSPVEFVVGVARAFECFDPPPSSVVLPEWFARLGQDLFYPPNVGGWPGGRAWLTSQGIIGRANYAVALVEGQLWNRPDRLEALALVQRHERGRDLSDTITFAAELLTGSPPDDAWRKRLLTDLGPRAKLDGNTALAALALVAASPEVQTA
jgi:uncharacterized protein (DUF1800 family)